MYYFSCRGDIVEIQSPFNPDLMLCKRIIAMEGDKVTKTNSDSVYVSTGNIIDVISFQNTVPSFEHSVDSVQITRIFLPF